MNLNRLKFLLFFIIFALISACGKADISAKFADSGSNPRGFFWEVMNQYYYWYEDVPNLSDNRFSSKKEFYDFANSYESPEKFFQSLLLKPKDRFSWVQNDYDELGKGFQGISKSFGYKFGLRRIADNDNDESNDKIFGYVKYVIPNSPASRAGLKRGDVFVKINNTSLNIKNYSELLYQSTTQKIELSKVVDKKIISTNKSVSLVAQTLQENPIHLKKVLDIDGIKIGYLCYNQFVSNEKANKELNDAFGFFKNEGITEMVLDLRYNPGGYLLSSQIMGSMLYGESSNDKLFASIVYNNKQAKQGWNSSLKFFNKLPDPKSGEPTNISINKININKLFVLTDGGTASASELIIAGMKPFMDVITIGGRTYGKNVGSLTFYDSPDRNYLYKDGANPNHKYAIQPIVSQLANSKGFTDYTEGFTPNIPLNEVDNLENMKELGDSEEYYLAEAIAIITNKIRPTRKPNTWKVEVISDSEKQNKLIQTSLIENFMLN